MYSMKASCPPLMSQGLPTWWPLENGAVTTGRRTGQIKNELKKSQFQVAKCRLTERAVVPLKSRNDDDEALDLITDMVRRAKRTLGPGHNVTKVYEAALSEHQTKMSSKESK